MGGVAIGLLPWTVYLSITLPPRHESAHWDIVWPGLDVGIALAVAVMWAEGQLPKPRRRVTVEGES